MQLCMDFTKLKGFVFSVEYWPKEDGLKLAR